MCVPYDSVASFIATISTRVCHPCHQRTIVVSLWSLHIGVSSLFHQSMLPILLANGETTQNKILPSPSRKRVRRRHRSASLIGCYLYCWRMFIFGMIGTAFQFRLTSSFVSPATFARRNHLRLSSSSTFGGSTSRLFMSSSSLRVSISGQTLVSLEDALALHSNDKNVKFVDGSWFLGTERNGRTEFQNGPRYVRTCERENNAQQIFQKLFCLENSQVQHRFRSFSESKGLVFWILVRT